MRRLRRWLLLGLVIALVAVFWRMEREPEIATGSVLLLDLQGEYVEAA